MRIEVDDLTVYRGATRAVAGIDWTADSGWTGLIGANGSGKTSLLRALGGRLGTSSGIIRVDGVDRSDDRGWRARTIGFAPDIASLPETLSGRELFAIMGFARLNNASGPLAPLCQALDIDRFLDRRIGTLSAGMRQRLAIFAAFLSRPSVVILDEPFNWLDPVCAYDTKEALRDLARQGLTLITALHELATLVHYCDSGLLLSEGRVSGRLDSNQLAFGSRDYAAFETRMVEGLRTASAGGKGRSG